MSGSNLIADKRAKHSLNPVADMDINYPTVEEPATREYVLSVFRHAHRQNLGELVACPDEIGDLNFETTVSDWMETWDNEFLLTSEIGRSLNRWWKIDCTPAEWQSVLKPAKAKRLKDVCELIASRTILRRIRPANIFGRSCEEAGAFLTVRSMLADEGAEISQLTPSTPLHPYLEKFSNVFCNSIASLNPDKVPTLEFERPIVNAACCAMLAGWLAFVAGWLASWPICMVAGTVVAVVAYATCWIGARWLPPKSVEFGSLKTFRDLSVALADAKSF